jgi:magnesium transporter
MDTDDAVDIIQDLDEEKQEEVLAHIGDIEQASDIVDLMQYDEDTAGGLMGTEMVVVNENMSMPECLQEMRKQAEDLDEIYNVYVVDDDGRLKGVFPLKKMITNPSVSKVKYVMDEDVISTKVDTPIDDVVQMIEKYNLVSVPVIDSIGRLQGQITVDDVIDELREQQEHDYQMASGLTSDVETDDSVFRQMWARIPWLLIGMLGGILNSMLLGKFEPTLQCYVGLLLFIPLIGGTGGNVGTQSSAIVVQGLANGSLNTSNIWKQVFKESAVALLNAIVLSLIVLGYNIYQFGFSETVTYAVPVSLFALVLIGTLWGTLLPLIFEKIHIDPAIATGPFVQITNDLLGMGIYMLVITLII